MQNNKHALQHCSSESRQTLQAAWNKLTSTCKAVVWNVWEVSRAASSIQINVIYTAPNHN